MMKKLISHVLKSLRKFLKKFSLAGAKKDRRFLKLSHGNSKLRDTFQTAFLVWNLPAIVTCPYATEACKRNCYACKAERVYPTVTPSRYRNLEVSKQDDFVERMVYTIDAEYRSQRVQLWGKKLVVRIHESGDFYDKEYAMKWIRIAEHFADNDGIIFIAYTKSLPFFRGENIPDNFIIRASVWCDTDVELELESYEKHVVYTAYTEEEIQAMRESGMDIKEIDETTPEDGAEWLVCRCSDCGNCNACWNRKYRYIVVAIH